jgi:hypothetical protein
MGKVGWQRRRAMHGDGVAWLGGDGSGPWQQDKRGDGKRSTPSGSRYRQEKALV